MNRSWTETQALAERAARGAGVPFAQAARFAAGVARHLAEGRDAADIAQALEDHEMILDISLDAERVIEAASIKGQPWSGKSDAPQLLKSVIEALPCASVVTFDGQQVQAKLMTAEPSKLARPDRLLVPGALLQQMDDLAKLTYVPDSAASRESGAGAGLMDLD